VSGTRLGLLIGAGLLVLVVRLWWTGHQAEAHAHRADSLYVAGQARERGYQTERARAIAERDALRRTADSTKAAADSALAADRRAHAALRQSAAHALGDAATEHDSLQVYQTLYVQADAQVENLLAQAEQQQRAYAALRRLQQADSGRADRADARGDQWKTIADSLRAANQDLLRHRGFHLALGGAKGMVAGAALVEVVRLVAGHP
jgi:hypothetical protein